MATTTTNFLIGPSDGWVQIAATAAAFIRVSGFPHTHPYYLSFSTSAPIVNPTFATGEVEFTGLPTATDTVSIGSETYTFVAAAAAPFEVTIGADADETGDNLVTTITADSTLVSAVNAAGTVTLTPLVSGTAGNYALVDNADNTTVSGANMTGGADVPLGVLACHNPFEVHSITTSTPLWARVVNPGQGGTNGAIRLDVVRHS